MRDCAAMRAGYLWVCAHPVCLGGKPVICGAFISCESIEASARYWRCD